MGAHLPSVLQWPVPTSAPLSAASFVSTILARGHVKLSWCVDLSPKLICCDLHGPKRELLPSSLRPFDPTSGLLPSRLGGGYFSRNGTLFVELSTGEGIPMYILFSRSTLPVLKNDLYLTVYQRLSNTGISLPL